MVLFVFVRKGCCICEALKNNLQRIDIETINPDLIIQEIDIDRYDLYKDKYKKYDLEVPVLALKNLISHEIVELPRVSPRLKDNQLRNWLEKNISELKNKL